MDLMTRPRIRAPNFKRWLVEWALLFDALVQIVSLSVVETNVFTSIVERYDTDYEFKCGKCGCTVYHAVCDDCGNPY